jgi:hypothetical protein
MDQRLYSPAARRNRDPILAVLREVLPPSGTVLEVGSGSGEHVVHFAPHFPKLTWQPSDPDPQARISIAAWIQAAHVRNVVPPLDLDARTGQWPITHADALICINMIHIAPWSACVGLMSGAGRITDLDGVLYLYGPFRVGGRHTAPSNDAFDQGLRQQNPEWGVRDLEAVVAEAERHGFAFVKTHTMPANNLSVVFRKKPAGLIGTGA